MGKTHSDDAEFIGISHKNRPEPTPPTFMDKWWFPVMSLSAIVIWWILEFLINKLVLKK